MKIAMIGQKGIPATFGGVERHVEEISTRLAENKYRVFVYARDYYTPKSKKRYKKLNIIHVPSIKTKHLDAISHTFFSTWHAILILRPDVIHFHGIGPALCLWLPKVFSPKTKVVFTFHCKDYFHQKWGGFAQFSLKLGEKIGCTYADQILAVSKDSQKYIKKNYKRNSLFAPHGTNSERPVAAKIIKKWGLNKNNYIIAVSRLIPHKGIHYLIKAYQRMDTDKKLVIAGSSFHTSTYENDLKALANNNPNIVFVGNQSGRALKELYSNAYVFVHPSEQEGLPLVVLEAAGFGKAMLLSDIPEHQDIFDHLPFYFHNKNITDLQKQLKNILKNDCLVKETGQKIKKFSQKTYTWDRSIKSIVASYCF